jgi:hypothetical protein
MKYVLLIAGLATAALAQQPTNEPEVKPQPVRLYIKNSESLPAIVTRIHKACSDITVTSKQDNADYQLDSTWSGYGRFWAGTLYKDGDYLASFQTQARFKNGFWEPKLVIDPRDVLAQQVCQKIEATKGSLTQEGK